MSKLINEELRAQVPLKKPVGKKGKLCVRLGRALPSDEIERLVEEGWSEALGWKP